MASLPGNAQTFTSPQPDDLPQRSLYKIALLLSGGFGENSPQLGDNEQILLHKIAAILEAAAAASS